mmetsp:Transcript_56692/g.139369  ORF Transcript_56692/g.139369 Transcript_56692/m.139369 type:complete len:251 (+) Transcript_56692:324-1076(+)
MLPYASTFMLESRGANEPWLGPCGRLAAPYSPGAGVRLSSSVPSGPPPPAVVPPPCEWSSVSAPYACSFCKNPLDAPGAPRCGSKRVLSSEYASEPFEPIVLCAPRAAEPYGDAWPVRGDSAYGSAWCCTALMGAAFSESLTGALRFCLLLRRMRKSTHRSTNAMHASATTPTTASAHGGTLPSSGGAAVGAFIWLLPGVSVAGGAPPPGAAAVGGVAGVGAASDARGGDAGSFDCCCCCCCCCVRSCLK